MKKLAIVLTLVASIATTAKADTLFKTGWVTDGDTIRIYTPKEVKVRLAFIDAPESKQLLGEKSKWYLIGLLKNTGNQVSVVSHGEDRYKRLLGEIYDRNGKSINIAMVRAGMAYFYRKYCQKNECDYQAYDAAEQEAIAAKRGVWGASELTPWDYRHREREIQKQK
ncbi:MAG: thermonuclease family protein [Snowella sp.]|nr:thermonuclease family protein [Snowella sp.]